MSTRTPDPDDPLGLNAIDQAIRSQELEEQAKSLGMREQGVSDGCTPEERIAFLGNVLDYESAPVGTQFDRLEQAGITLLPPDSMNDAALHAKLWDVIRALASWSSYLWHTDHLSDRELYSELWGDVLREPVAMFPAGSGWNNYIDMIGSGSETDLQIGLRYYDDDESRERWSRDWPDLVIPPHEKLPFDRDRLLPHPVEPSHDAGSDDDCGFDVEGTNDPDGDIPR